MGPGILEEPNGASFGILSRMNPRPVVADTGLAMLEFGTGAGGHIDVANGVTGHGARVSSILNLLSKIGKTGREGCVLDVVAGETARLKLLLLLSDSAKILAISASIRSWRARSRFPCVKGLELTGV